MTASRSLAATRLLPRYLEHRERDITTLRQALEHDDFASIASIGHNLRGNGRGYGFPEIGTLGQALEVAARAHNAASVRQHVLDLEAWLAQNRVHAGAPGEVPPHAESNTRVRSAGVHRAEPDDDE